MPKPVSGLKVVKFLKKKGFEVFSRKGSHIKMISRNRKTKAIIPMHKEISRGTLNSVLKQAKLTKEEITELKGK